MTKLKDARIAAAIAAVTVLLSLLLGVSRTVSSRVSALNAMFHEGVDRSGYGIAGDLIDRQDDALILLKIAAKYPEAKAEYDALEAALLEVQSAPDATVGEQYRLDAALESAFLSLDLRLQALPLSEQDETYRAEYAADFASRGLTMGREAEAYNAQVRQFEEKVMGGLAVRLTDWLLPLPEAEEFR